MAWQNTLDALAPLRFAGDWDNVGLILEGTREVRRALVCIDLTEPVLAEALAAKVDLILSYHPPLFRGVKRLTGGSAPGRVLLGALRAGVHVYAPHTALDASPLGMGDWLAVAAGRGSFQPIEPNADEPAAGLGRLTTLEAPVDLATAVERIKAHLGIPALRLAAPAVERPISTVACCPGAGGSVFEKVGPVDLLLTGEMRHHDVLWRAAEGTAVVLTDHTHCERGYLPTYAARVAAALGIEVVVSQVDADPLRVV